MTFNFSPNFSHSNILAIESSCDDTSVSIISKGKILANIVAGQKVHEKWGGVVPELASRAHQANIIPTLNDALNKANIVIGQLDGIAFTQGPGLAGSLIVGMNVAKGLSIGLDIPLIGINHIQAHIAALFIENESIETPCLTLLVSGGHTNLLLINNDFSCEVIGSTIDDAAGEAFDKGAKILGLPYPGGPLIDKYAAQGNKDFHKFPVSDVPELNFSFSGVKTSLLYYLQKQNATFLVNNRNDICASYQKAIIDMLFLKLNRAVRNYKPKSLALAGGVSANSELRNQILNKAKNEGLKSYIPSFEYCTDNAAMIAAAAAMVFDTHEFASLSQNLYTKWN
jgi:N6-L-threonylcarbamoyladenine synthase